MVLAGYEREVLDRSATVVDTHIDEDNGDFEADQYTAEEFNQTLEWQPLLERGVHVREGSPVRVRHAFIE